MQTFFKKYWWVLALLLAAGVGYYFYTQNQKKVDETAPGASPTEPGNTLPDGAIPVAEA